MKRRTFISLAGVTAAFWFPSIVWAGQKLISEELVTTSCSISPPHKLDEREHNVESGWHTVIKIIGIGGAGGKRGIEVI